jgi:hypothetical protein
MRKHFLLADQSEAEDWMLSKTGRKGNAEELRLWKLKKKRERPLGGEAARAEMKSIEEITSAAGP